MNEAKAREIHLATDLSTYSRDELKWADAWVQHYALEKLRTRMAFNQHMKVPPALRAFVNDMARFHYGSIEVDKLLLDMKCYPTWATRE